MKENSLNLFSYNCFLIPYYLRQGSLEDTYISIICNVNKKEKVLKYHCIY